MREERNVKKRLRAFNMKGEEKWVSIKNGSWYGYREEKGSSKRNMQNEY